MAHDFTRHPLGLGDPELYALVDVDERASDSAPSHLFSERVRLIHVISPAAGGEIRGYVLHEGRAYLRSPCYEGRWPEVDDAVARVLGVVIEPYEIESSMAGFPRVEKRQPTPAQGQLFPEAE